MILMIGSPPRTGSTLCYQLAVNLLQASGKGQGISPYWTSENPIYQNPAHYAKQSEWYVTKKHAYDAVLDNIKNVRVITCHRNLYEVGASLCTFFNVDYTELLQNFPMVWMKMYTSWFAAMKPEQILELRYETDIVDIEKLTHKICDFLAIPYNQDVITQCTVESNQKRLQALTEKDEYSFRPNHIRNNKTQLPLEVKQTIYSAASNYFIEKGYDKEW